MTNNTIFTLGPTQNQTITMAYSEEILASSVIVLGNFNPAISPPDWFEKNQLIGAEDAEIAALYLPHITQF